MMRSYDRDPCPVCGRLLRCSGASFVAHLRVHVREGKLRALPANNYNFRADGELVPYTVTRFVGADDIAVYTCRSGR